jgi:hypothetical protein
MITIGMDIGLRSNGIIVLNSNGNIIDMLLIPTYAAQSNTGTKTRITLNSEYIIIYNCDLIVNFINSIRLRENVEIRLGLERLSYNSISSSKDILAGIHWSIRCYILNQLDMHCQIISPNEWRKGIITTWDKVKYELLYPDEDMNKIIPYYKLPILQKIMFYFVRAKMMSIAKI